MCHVGPILKSSSNSVDTYYGNGANKKTSKHIDGDVNITFIAEGN